MAHKLFVSVWLYVNEIIIKLSNEIIFLPPHIGVSLAPEPQIVLALYEVYTQCDRKQRSTSVESAAAAEKVEWKNQILAILNA
jgi:hypothetical protein